MARLDDVNGAEGHKSLSVQFGGTFLNVVYENSRVTPESEEELINNVVEHRPARMIKDLLLRYLVSWDLETVHPDDVKKPVDKQRLVPVPLNDESLHRLLSSKSQERILEAIHADQRPSPEASGNSENI